MSSLSANALTVRRYDRERFVTALFASPECREDLFTLYAFNLEIARIRETVREGLLGQIKLQWWRDGLDAMWAGRAIGHPVADQMALLVARTGLPRFLADALLDARDLDMTDEPPASLADFQRYVAGSAGALLQMGVYLLGGQDIKAQQAASLVGQAWGTIGLLRAHAYHIKTRRLSLPADWLADHGLDREALLSGEAPPELAHLALHLADMAADHLRQARLLRRDVTKSAQAPLLLAILADGYLKRLRHCSYNLLDKSWSAVDSRPLALLFASFAGRF